MTSVADPVTETPAVPRRIGITPAVEFLVLGIAVAVALASWLIITGNDGAPRLLSPPLVALLLVANMVPDVALLVLIGRRSALRRAAQSPLAGEGRLHVRLVALFSVLASVPMILVTVFASLLFQYGVEFWSSDRARGMLENAQSLAQQSYQEMLSYVDNENVALAEDIHTMLVVKRWPIDSREFVATFGQDVYQRSLSEAVVFSVAPDGRINALALVNPYERSLETDIGSDAIARLKRGERSVVSTSRKRTQSIARVEGTDLYVYSARVSGAQEMAARMNRAQTVLADYQTLLQRSRSLQLRFNIALLFVSLLIVGAAVFVALAVADRLVRPIGALVDAAQRIAGGDLAARVPEPKTDDEIGVLASAFNRMTGRLQQQTGALVEATSAADSRRALIEAVLSGVTAGVIAIGDGGTIRLINSSALDLLRPADSPLGRPLGEVAPELAALLAGEAREGIVQLTAGGEARTLAVKITRDEDGHVLTFDDITQQLLDQRRAAWSDVARRIAHEIKNPLTPIQLAAERLQRRYGKLAPEADTTFARLTDTIVRQVGDLRRMVDEFSSFARMPKPVFRSESLLDLARQAVFLHEVAHPAIRFALSYKDPPPTLICDRRQIGQALTNIVKNAVEAIEGREGEGLPVGEIAVALEADERSVTVRIADNGVGLPAERDRIVEPYMTTRSRGTGLGLAIVKKIVEEHFGTIAFADGPDERGTVVTLIFDSLMLADVANGQPDDAETTDPSPANLTRHRTTA
ncbi:sensor histidine kinase [Sphingomonas sp.]|uniref:sensor histidine kinase n=1 Tax=Sphingomonas sp. TaxID=28214 RepID=UPI002D08AD64|nr:ATP-binding protein [Sphingomonas sp.]HWK34624.1 ATP-binding protein [Sphingomonas sp.]